MQSVEIQEFVAQIIHHMRQNIPRIEKALAEISDAECWERPNSQSNAIGNLMLHLCGNITQYVISGLGGQEDVRDRDAEFAARTGAGKQALMDQLHTVITKAAGVLGSLDQDAFLKRIKVQGFDLSGMAIAIHVCEHLSYHTGQIAFQVKALKNKDLDFYAGIDLNAKNG